MTKITRNTENHEEAGYAMYALTLERARRRYAGEELPVTCLDEELTGETIYNITCDFDGARRLGILTSSIGSFVASIRPFEDRTQALVDVPRLLREQVKEIAKIPECCKRPIKNGDSRAGALDVSDAFVELSDGSRSDTAFDRAFRRRAGEDLEITMADLEGTLALIHQLMIDIEVIVLIVVTAKAIVEEYDGVPPDGVLVEIESLIRKLVTESDLMKLSYDGPMN